MTPYKNRFGSPALLLTLALAASLAAAADDELIFVTQISATGARGGIGPDPLNSTWQYGAGELTPMGMRQEYLVGFDIRKNRYGALIDEVYSPFQVNVFQHRHEREVARLRVREGPHEAGLELGRDGQRELELQSVVLLEMREHLHRQDEARELRRLLRGLLVARGENLLELFGVGGGEGVFLENFVEVVEFVALLLAVAVFLLALLAERALRGLLQAEEVGEAERRKSFEHLCFRG